MFASQSGTADEGIHIISRITNFIWNKFSDRKSVDSVCVNQNKLPEMLQVSSELVKDVVCESRIKTIYSFNNDACFLNRPAAKTVNRRACKFTRMTVIHLL